MKPNTDDNAYVPSPDELVHNAEDFRVSAARETLAGNAKGLLDGFSWPYCPQGDYFWYLEYASLRDGEPLSPKARAILEASIKAYEENGEGDE